MEGSGRFRQTTAIRKFMQTTSAIFFESFKSTFFPPKTTGGNRDVKCTSVMIMPYSSTIPMIGF